MRQVFLDSLHGRKVVKPRWEELRQLFEPVWVGKSDRMVRHMDDGTKWTVTRTKAGNVHILIDDKEYREELGRQQKAIRDKNVQEFLSRSKELVDERQSRQDQEVPGVPSLPTGGEGLGGPGLPDTEVAGQGGDAGGKGLRGDTGRESGWVKVPYDTNVFHGPESEYFAVRRGKGTIWSSLGEPQKDRP